jgi:hypothetical protein
MKQNMFLIIDFQDTSFMHSINLCNKASCLTGEITSYWFENNHIGLEKTLFHRITIPLTPFDSGLEYEEQPLVTSIHIDWIELNLANPSDLNGLIIDHQRYPGTECTIYAGSAHNPCDINSLIFTKTVEDLFHLSGIITIDFEHERVAANEQFTIDTLVRYTSETNGGNNNVEALI